MNPLDASTGTAQVQGTCAVQREIPAVAVKEALLLKKLFSFPARPVIFPKYFNGVGACGMAGKSVRVGRLTVRTRLQRQMCRRTGRRGTAVSQELFLHGGVFLRQAQKTRPSCRSSEGARRSLSGMPNRRSREANQGRGGITSPRRRLAKFLTFLSFPFFINASFFGKRKEYRVLRGTWPRYGGRSSRREPR